VNPEEIGALVLAHREVTREEAFRAALQLMERIDEGDSSAFSSLGEIVGFAATSSDAEMTRRWIVMQLEHGPFTS
jgi:hypothetical protein